MRAASFTVLPRSRGRRPNGWFAEKRGTPDFRRWLASLFLSVVVTPATTVAEVVVVANRTPRKMVLEVTLSGQVPWSVKLASGESRPIFSDGGVEIAFERFPGTARYQLDSGAAYYLGMKQDGTIDLQKIGLGDPEGETRAGQLPGKAATAPAATVLVKILVDEEELSRRHLWEPKLRRRMEAASDILHRHAMVQLSVVAVGRWNSDDSTRQFRASLSEFEKEVDASPATLAIGFSSQYHVVRGRVHLGGTRGPLKPHILLREWSAHVSESERLELLLHELGHYLGASHSPEPDSVMRPVLGDRQSRRTGFVVKFDPVNTLLMSMMGEEIRRRRVRDFASVTTETKNRMEQVYKVLGLAQPRDTSPRRLAQQLRNQPSDPLFDGAKRILARITRVARDNSRAPKQPSRSGPARLQGDDLLNAYLRAAAKEASKVPDEVRSKAFLLAIGVGIGDSDQLRKLPALRPLVARLETPADRSVRRNYLGKPSIQGRNDLARHFCGAAMLVATSGASTAETLSLAKEIMDSQGGTGFSFADLAADKAGIAFALRLLEGKLTVEAIAARFRSADFVPPVGDLPEGMSTPQFMEQFGGAHDERYQQVVEEIDQAIQAMFAERHPTAP